MTPSNKQLSLFGAADNMEQARGKRVHQARLMYLLSGEDSFQLLLTSGLPHSFLYDCPSFASHVVNKHSSLTHLEWLKFLDHCCFDQTLSNKQA